MNDFFNWIVNIYDSVLLYFNSLSPEWLLIYMIGINLVVILFVVLIIRARVKKHKKHKLEKQKLEENKKDLEEFVSSPIPKPQEETKVEVNEEVKSEVLEDKPNIEVKEEPKQEVEKPLVVEEKTEEVVTSEPVIEEVKKEIPQSYMVEKTDGEHLDKAFAKEHHVERSEKIDEDFSDEVESEKIDVDDHLVRPDIHEQEVEVKVSEEPAPEVKAEQQVDEQAKMESVDKEQKQGTFDFVKTKEQKPLLGFRQKIIDSESDVKARYCDIVNFAMSYKKIKVRSSESGEKFYYGSNLLFMLKLHGKTLRAYYALRFADYENTTMPVSDESAKKSYEKVPVMLKVTSALALRRAKSLVSDVMTRFACEKGKEKTIVTVQELTSEMQQIAQTEIKEEVQ